MAATPAIDPASQRFPFCLVWTPIPVLTWLLPFVGHMGMGMSSGLIRDFAGPYTVGEGELVFGKVARYLQLCPSKATDGARGWDNGVREATETYKGRMHRILCDNCHSYVAYALAEMGYGGKSSSWNMFVLAAWMFVRGKHVGIGGVLKTWLPFLVLVATMCCLVIIPSYT